LFCDAASITQSLKNSFIAGVPTRYY